MINIDFRKYWGKITRTLASKSRDNLNIKPLLVGLRKRIYDRQDIILFDEVVRCIKVRAYRMAYIAIWINIAESLKNKFKIISQKDKVVDKIVQEIDEMENKHIPPDRYILEKAKDLGMLDEVVYAKLVNILTMRNLYAHPYQQEPSGLDVISALTISVDKVLSAPPLLRKSYIDNLLITLQTNRHFIDDHEDKITRFTIEVINRIASNLHPYFIKKLFYHLNFVINDPDLQIFSRRLIWTTITSIREIKPVFTAPEWQLQEKFVDFPKVVSTIFVTPDLWKMIQENIQDSIVSYLLFPEIDKKVVIPESWALHALFGLSENKLLSQHQNEKLTDCLDRISLEKLAEIGVPFNRYVQRTISSLSSHDWNTQNSAAEALQQIGPEGILLTTPSNQEILGRNVLQSADGNAYLCINFLMHILNSTYKWPKSFIQGILFECFVNEKNEFRCKFQHLKTAIQITIRKTQGDGKTIFDSLLEQIETSKLKYPYVDLSYLKINETIDQIKECIADLIGLEKDNFETILYKLIESLNKKKGKTLE